MQHFLVQDVKSDDEDQANKRNMTKVRAPRICGKARKGSLK